MIDIKRIKEDKANLEKAFLKRMDEVDLDYIIELDEIRRARITEVDELKATKNKVSKQIPTYDDPEDKQAAIEEMTEIGWRVDILDGEIKGIEEDLKYKLSVLPNIPDDDVLPGGKENNKVVRTSGEKPVFDYEILDHVEIAKKHDLIDYERGAKISGNGFWIYKNTGALLEWALINYFVEKHLSDGYEFLLPPHILNTNCGFTAGQFPKFDEEVYYVGEKRDKFLIPTSETVLTSIHMNETFKADNLPIKYFAYTPNYRTEAGGYRSDERGTIRGHQFNKVEMFQITTEDQSSDALFELIGKAEDILKDLQLHYQVTKLAARDASSSMAITYDIEVWLPSLGKYLEVSSASNARDYQARRGNIKYFDDNEKKYCHTLNTSGLATSRLLPAILEQNQMPDGKIKVPDVLKKWIGKEYIGL